MQTEGHKSRHHAGAFRHGMIIPLSLAFFLAAGVFLETSREKHLVGMREAARAQVIPTAQLTNGTMGHILRQMRTVRPVTNDFSIYPKVARQDFTPDENIFVKKRKIGDFLYQVNPAWLSEWQEMSLAPDDGVRPEHFRPGWPLVSIVVNEDDMDSSERGILTHWRDRGKEWEREAHVTYYEEGRLLFSTRAGLRLHGGKSREPGNWHSYRLYFRDQYGAEQWPAGLFPDPGADPIRCMLLLNDWPALSPFVSALAFDFAERLGCPVQKTVPTMLFINGRSQGIYYLCERLTPEAYASRVGHSDVLFYLGKQTQQKEARDLNSVMRARFRDLSRPLTMSEAAEYVDLDNQAARVLITVYNGTTNGLQGPVVLDKGSDNPRWFWIPWDLDHSFVDVYNWAEKETWGKKTWSLIYRGVNPPSVYRRFVNQADTLRVLFSRLMNDDPEYCRWFTRKTMDAVNHRLNPRFTGERLAHYERMAKAYGVKDMSFMDVYRNFLKKRPAFVCEQFSRSFGVGEPYTCTVKGPDGIPFEIDGYPESASYEGIYFGSHQIRVSVPAPEWRTRFSHWMVNGEKRDQASLDLVVRGPLNIEAVCR